MRCLSFRLSILALVGLLAVLSTGCSTTGASEPLSASGSKAEDESTWAYFIDTTDQGDDIWSAGCHYKCSDAECDGPTEFWGGDWCVGSDLQEWTTGDPHAAASDITRYDCDHECKAKGLFGGQCVRVEKACGDTWPSSVCECDGPESAS